MSDTPRTRRFPQNTNGHVNYRQLYESHEAMERELAAVTRERDEARTKRLETLANVTDERDALRAEVERAIPAMRAYAATNPLHNSPWKWQDPNGVHAWLSRNDKQEPTP